MTPPLALRSIVSSMAPRPASFLASGLRLKSDTTSISSRSSISCTVSGMPGAPSCRGMPNTSIDTRAGPALPPACFPARDAWNTSVAPGPRTKRWSDWPQMSAADTPRIESTLLVALRTVPSSAQVSVAPSRDSSSNTSAYNCTRPPPLHTALEVRSSGKSEPSRCLPLTTRCEVTSATKARHRSVCEKRDAPVVRLGTEIDQKTDNQTTRPHLLERSLACGICSTSSRRDLSMHSDGCSPKRSARAWFVDTMTPCSSTVSAGRTGVPGPSIRPVWRRVKQKEKKNKRARHLLSLDQQQSFLYFASPSSVSLRNGDEMHVNFRFRQGTKGWVLARHNCHLQLARVEVGRQHVLQTLNRHLHSLTIQLRTPNTRQMSQSVTWSNEKPWAGAFLSFFSKKLEASCSRLPAEVAR